MASTRTSAPRAPASSTRRPAPVTSRVSPAPAATPSAATDPRVTCTCRHAADDTATESPAARRITVSVTPWRRRASDAPAPPATTTGRPGRRSTTVWRRTEGPGGGSSCPCAIHICSSRTGSGPRAGLVVPPPRPGGQHLERAGDHDVLLPGRSAVAHRPRPHPGEDLDVAVVVDAVRDAGGERVVVVRDERAERGARGVVVGAEGEAVAGDDPVGGRRGALAPRPQHHLGTVHP